MSDATADINATISTPMDNIDLDISAAELEAELEDLLAADQQPQKQTQEQRQKPPVTDLHNLDDLSLGKCRER